MRNWSLAGFTFALVASFAGERADAQSTYDLGDAKHLKVLYAGSLDSPRAKSFVDFLKANFDEVGTVAVTELSAAKAKPFDVVVCDGKRLYPMDPKKGLDNPAASLGADFTRPIVMIGAMGGSVQHHTKIDWL